VGRIEEAEPVGALTRVAAVAVAAAAVAVAVVLLVGRSVPAHGARPADALAVRTSFEPPAAQFGDRVVARVVVAADASAVDVSRIRITASVAPLTQLAAPTIVRTTQGRLAVVTYEVPAVCIDEGCIAAKGPRPLRLAAVRVDAPRAGGTAELAVRWPLLELRSRVDGAGLVSGRPQFRADSTYPPATYRIAPHTLAPLLDAIAAVLAVAGIAWGAWQASLLVRRRRAVDTRNELDRALALVREAEARPTPDRRRAVGLLARVLRTHDVPLAHDAGELAWSRPAPAPDELDALADRVVRTEAAP
jgi:hypothetical protein